MPSCNTRFRARSGQEDPYKQKCAMGSSTLSSGVCCSPGGYTEDLLRGATDLEGNRV